MPARFVNIDHDTPLLLPPDQDSVCKFRRDNKVLLGGVFHQVLEMAARSRVLRVGDLAVSVDGTKILASAIKHSVVSYGHCGGEVGDWVIA